mmetsp:Transcript_25643/g.47838  ORF Transcript_25643/g.47838 Transcript_25643/m.47838 type:complete len:261 (+) Transcript_25643:796-1578(+)
MRCVSTCIATFVVRVNCQVKPHKFDESRVIVSAHMSVVGSPIKAWISFNQLTFLEFIAIDHCRNCWKLGNEVKRILQYVRPILGFRHVSPHVSFGKCAFGLQSKHCRAKLRHRVHFLREIADHLFSMGRDDSAFGKLGRETLHFLLSGNFPCEKKPEQSLGEWFLAARSGRKKFLAFGDGVPPKTDTLLCIQERCLSDHPLDSTHPTDGLVNSYLAQNLIAVLRTKVFDVRTPLGNTLGDGFLYRSHSTHICPAHMAELE